jgi:hypothetical protein
MLAVPIYRDSYSRSSCYHDRRRATQPHFIAGPLGVIAELLPRDKQHLDNFLLPIIWYRFIKKDIYKENYGT